MPTAWVARLVVRSHETNMVSQLDIIDALNELADAHGWHLTVEFPAGASGMVTYVSLPHREDG